VRLIPSGVASNAHAMISAIGKPMMINMFADADRTDTTHPYVQPVNIALAHTALGEKDKAFAWLDKACEEHAQWLSEIKVDRAFDPLRSDARFTDLLKRVGFSPVHQKA